MKKVFIVTLVIIQMVLNVIFVNTCSNYEIPATVASTGAIGITFDTEPHGYYIVAPGSEVRIISIGFGGCKICTPSRVDRHYASNVPFSSLNFRILDFIKYVLIVVITFYDRVCLSLSIILGIIGLIRKKFDKSNDKIYRFALVINNIAILSTGLMLLAVKVGIF